MLNNLEQAIIPLSHIDNYFNLKKVIFSVDENGSFNQSSTHTWLNQQPILEVISGLKAEQVYKRVGINQRQPIEQTLITTQQCIDIVNIVKKELPIDHLALLIGKVMTLSHHGQAGIAVMLQDTLEDCMKAACRFGDRLFPPILFRYKEEDKFSSINLDEYIELDSAYQFFVEIKLTSFYFIFKHLMGKEHEPEYINFSFPEPSYSQIYRRYFKCKINFSAAQSEIAFPLHLVKKTLPLANRFMAIQAENTLFESLPINTINLLPLRLRKLLLKSYGAFPSLESAADYFGMSGRTLRRRLTDEGVSYQLILNEVRSQLSKELLMSQKNTITEIAFLLGFNETSAFTKAFKRWTGISPTDYRNQTIDLE